MRPISITCFAVLLGLSAAAVAAGPVLYRFNNEAGERVYSYTLPPDQANAGYQRIDARTGEVLESVAPPLAPAELAKQRRHEQAMQVCRDELERIYQLYGSEADIEHARQKALDALDTRIGQLQSNLTQARREQSLLRAQAADAERLGRQISPTLLDNLERSHSQIETLQAEIEQRNAEQDQAQGRYARELARFRHGACPEPGTLADANAATP